MTMMNEEQRVEAIAKQMKEDETNAIKLYTDWCNIKGYGYLPPTPMDKWREFIETYDVDIKKMWSFCDWHYWFYVIDGHLTTFNEVREEIEYSDNFNDCIRYYAETLERYDRAMAILKDEKFIINEVSPDFYI